MPNLIPPKIPDGEKVDFDVREKVKGNKNIFGIHDLFPKWFLSLIFIEIFVMQSCEPHVSAGYPS